MTNPNAMETAKALWHRQRIKRLVRSRLGHGVACLVSVRETICTDPDCPGPATEVRVVNVSMQEFRLTIHKPLDAVVIADISGVI
ncbi:hypothetical protein DSM110093_02603 [Sulfitobacter sp. DSM 110093]|nr:hypothetical protein DSM110093_02603 [Sulfitobacter sp. DSM 110093]